MNMKLNLKKGETIVKTILVNTNEIGLKEGMSFYYQDERYSIPLTRLSENIDSDCCGNYASINESTVALLINNDGEIFTNDEVDAVFCSNIFGEEES